MSQYIQTLQSYLPKSEPLRSVSTTLALGAATFVAAKIVFGITGAISSARRNAAAKSRRAAQKKDTVYLFGFPKTATGIQLSAAVERVELYLKMKNIPYEYVPTMDNSLSDTGRFPFAELNGAQITDSKFIIDAVETAFNKGADELDRDQQTKLTSIAALCEYIRWHHYRNVMIDYPEFTIEMFSKFTGYPKFAVGLYVNSQKKKMIRTWNDAGHGDLSDDQYQQQFLEDLKAVDYYCEQANKNNSFILGTSAPTKGDALLTPWLKTYRRPEVLAGKVPAFAFACSNENFKTYIERVEKAVQ